MDHVELYFKNIGYLGGKMNLENRYKVNIY